MKKNSKLFEISQEDSSERIDSYLSKKLNIPRNKILLLIKDNMVKVNSINVKPSYRIKKDDQISVELLSREINEINPENIPLDIVYEDKNLIIINKPRGMLTHPTPKVKSGTLVNALLYYTKNLSLDFGVERAGIVHRLDKDTSGLLIITKNSETHNYIAKLLKERKIEKRYLALVYGNINENFARVTLPLINDHRMRRIKVSNTGKFALTDISVKERFGDYTLLDIRIHTGRTHQIRVHLSYIGHPVVGDTVYGFRNRDEDIGGQLLHSYKLSFVLPTSREISTFIAPLPIEFSNFLNRLKNKPPNNESHFTK
jgi:23S rRNA pseudouridine1911/1915/1917 synthase